VSFTASCHHVEPPNVKSTRFEAPERTSSLHASLPRPIVGHSSVRDTAVTEFR